MFNPFVKSEKQNDKEFELHFYLINLITKAYSGKEGINNNKYIGVLIMFIFLKFIIK